VIVTSVQFVALKLACPYCGASIDLNGRLDLTPGRRMAESYCVCEHCGNRAYLTLDPASR